MEFTRAEIQREIKKLKSGKSRDRAGVCAEMLKNGGDLLMDAILQLFNDLLKPNSLPPGLWRESSITVLFKSGDLELPENSRPITIIPLLYKLFSRLLRTRLTPILERAQTPDQAGFRTGYGVEDHLFSGFASTAMRRVAAAIMDSGH